MAKTNKPSLQGSCLLAERAPRTCRSERVDFAKAGLPEYANSFAMLIHDILTPDECQGFLEAAESTTNGKWEQAMVNIGNGKQALYTDTRNCGRIMWDDKVMAERLLARIQRHLPPDILSLKDKAYVTGYGPVKRNETWRLSRLNERLRFLKYTSGMYFREHCDGSYVTPDHKEISYLTIQLYLNGDPAPVSADHAQPTESREDAKNDLPLVGGATRFFGNNCVDFVDVVPESGSCLVFQHRNLLHSGEEVRILSQKPHRATHCAGFPPFPLANNS